jgi:hypothetical protein
MAKAQAKFPGGSREAVTRAGNAVRHGEAELADLTTIEVWRAAHRRVLNSFQAILRNRTRGQKVVVAQRHKRRRTIFDKLRRYPKMQLGRMDDVAGCRLIFEDINALYQFRERLHAARFDHRLRNETDKYDYIKRPKATGYRGIHDVYDYDVRSETGRDFKGLYIELQYRTIYQHAWATTVEVVGHITENQPKFEQGDPRFLEILALASEIIARAFEQTTSCYPHMSSQEIIQRFVLLDDQVHLIDMLKGLNAADKEISDDKNVILMFGEGRELEIVTYRDAPEALRALFKLEKERPGQDIVLARGESSEDVRDAFRNYFSDARDFINYIDEGCKRLMKARNYEDEFLTDADLADLELPVAD